jgi:hemin uptake protein HemP
MICFGLGWRALQKLQRLAGCQFQDAGIPPASFHYWLRGGLRRVNNAPAHFIPIVNRNSWIARRPTYNGIQRSYWSGTTRAMSAASGDDPARNDTNAGKASPATRSVAVSGNRIVSRELFSSEREIMILHGEETYRLRLTSQNKLILTK